MIINGRLSFVNVFEAQVDLSGNAKFGVMIMIPKNDEKQLASIRLAIDEAKAYGVGRGRFSSQQAKSPKFKSPLRDGDEYYEEKPCATRESCKGHFFINARNKDKPGVVDRFGQPIIDPSEIYSGCYGLAEVALFPYSQNGNVGIGISLQNLLKKKDGDRLDGRQSAEAAFSKYIDSPEESDAGMM